MSTAAAITDDTARIKVLDAIKGKPGAVTISDVVARTGLPPYQAELQLNAIVKDYESDIDVDEDGNLIYRFKPGLPGREDIVKKDASRRRKERLRRGAIAFFKFFTVAMVIVSFIILVVLFIAASQGRDSRSSSSSRRRGFGGGMWLWWGMGSPWGYGGYGTSTSRRYRRRYNRDVERRIKGGEDPYDLSREQELKKPSIAERTWYYLFGTRGIKRNPLEQEKELITYIRAKKGFISNADIIALLGVTYEEADNIATRLVASYEGEMDLTDEGLAIYRFPNLVFTGAPEVQDEVAELAYLWQLRKKEQVLRDNPAKVVPILNVLNMILAVVAMAWLLPKMGWASLGMYILLGIIFGWAVVFFAKGMQRKARELRDKGKWERDNIRISIFKLLFARRTPVRIPGDERSIAAAGLGSWGADELGAVAADVAKELRGTVTKEGGALVLRVNRVWQEMGAVEKLRARADSARSIGKTVFSTRDGAVLSLGQGEAAGSDEELAAAIEALEQELAE